MISQTPRPMPNGASHGPRWLKASSKTVDRQRDAGGGHAGAALPPARSPRFHASSGPNGTAISSGTISGTKVRLKKGGPTEILSPVSASSASG